MGMLMPQQIGYLQQPCPSQWALFAGEKFSTDTPADWRGGTVVFLARFFREFSSTVGHWTTLCFLLLTFHRGLCVVTTLVRTISICTDFN